MSPDSVWRSEYEAAGNLAINRKAATRSVALLVHDGSPLTAPAGTSGEADLFWEYLQNGSLSA